MIYLFVFKQSFNLVFILFIYKELMSWNKSINIIVRLQKKLYKSSYVGDFSLSRNLQGLILQSNAAKYISIRNILQSNIDKKIVTEDGTSLSFLERLDLIEYLKLNYKNWFPQVIKNVSFVTESGKKKSYSVCAFSDSVWQAFVHLSLHPIHDSLFHPLNFGFRLNMNQYMVQKVLLLNLRNKSFSKQKRFFYFNVENIFVNFDIVSLVKKLKTFKSIKLGIFRFLRKNFLLYYCEKEVNKFSTLLCNVLLDGLHDIGNIYQYGSHILLVLNPLDNHLTYFNKITSFFCLLGIDFSFKNYSLFSLQNGFNFLCWNFIERGDSFISIPSNENYSIFLKRVKYIVNNSNYGVKVKATKLLPIINDWYNIHRYSNVKYCNFLIFSLKKRVLKVFIEESKQDFYSSKRLIDKCFFFFKSNSSYFSSSKKNIYFLRHLTYCFGHSNFLCIHCGVSLIFI